MKDDHRIQFELRQAIQAQQSGDFERAERIYLRVLRVRPKDPDALHLLGMIYFVRGQFKQALRNLDTALGIRPGEPNMLCNRSGVRLALGDTAGAIDDARAAVKTRPSFAGAYNNLGNALIETFQIEEAFTAYEKAINFDPLLAEAWSGRSLALFRKRHLQEAEASARRALALRPGLPDAWCSLGMALRDRGFSSEAMSAFGQALAINPNHGDTLFCRGITLSALGKAEEAIVDLQAARLRKRILGDVGEFLFATLNLCQWSEFETLLREVIDVVSTGKFCPVPFNTLAFLDDPVTHRKAAQVLVATMLRPQPRVSHKVGAQPTTDGSSGRTKHLRVGYLSADFRSHPVAYLLIDTLERHDRERFETVGFSIGPLEKTPFGERIQAAFDLFVDARDLSDEQLAAHIADQQIDLLVDLSGFTQHARTGVLARRPAPIQVNFLGYPGTMGAPYMDYIIADAVIAPNSEWFDEAVCLLPDTYQPTSALPVAEPAQRSDYGLPQDAFVFASFCNNWKITPDVFAIWMRLLAQTPNAVLWLLSNNATVIDNLRREAAAAGIDPQRLVFAARVSHAEHIARQALADLMLDTFPYGAHTTASDALWMGVPLITRSGQAFQTRVARSVLKAAGLERFAVDTADDYEALALKLAHDRAAYVEAKQAFAGARASALFDSNRYVRHLEAAYLAMAERAAAGLAPDRIEIAPIAVD